MSLFIKQNVFPIHLKNSFHFGAKIDFKNEEGIKIAYQVLKKILPSVLIQVCFIPIMLMLSCLLLHFQEETEAALESVL